MVPDWHEAATGLPWRWPRIVSDGWLEREFGQSEPDPVSIQTTKPMVVLTNPPSPSAGILRRTALSDNPD